MEFTAAGLARYQTFQGQGWGDLAIGTESSGHGQEPDQYQAPR
jgi:hypothetical protein